MTTVTQLVDLKAQFKQAKRFSYSQIAATALMSSYNGLIESYDPSKVYNTGDKVGYTTDAGEFLVIVCLSDGVTGNFDNTKWDEWNVMDELQGLYNDYVIASWNEPILRRNKVWIQVKEESIEALRGVLGNNQALLIYNNFIISENMPSMNSNIVWGRITSVL